MEIHGCYSVHTFVQYLARNCRSSMFDCIGCNNIHQNSVWNLGMASCRSFSKKFTTILRCFNYDAQTPTDWNEHSDHFVGTFNDGFEFRQTEMVMLCSCERVNNEKHSFNHDEIKAIRICFQPHTMLSTNACLCTFSFCIQICVYE